MHKARADNLIISVIAIASWNNNFDVTTKFMINSNDA